LLLDHASQPFHRALNEVERRKRHHHAGDRRPEAELGLVVAAENRRAKDFGGPAGGALKPLF
jgi:hypothetical protein